MSSEYYYAKIMEEAVEALEWLEAEQAMEDEQNES